MSAGPVCVNAASLGKPAGHYSHAAVAGGMAHVSGILPIAPDGKKLADEPFEIQVQQVFDNLDGVLAACGCSRSDLAQVRVYVTDIGLWPLFNELYASWLGDHRPARCVVPVPDLHYGLALEVEAVAAVPERA